MTVCATDPIDTLENMDPVPNSGQSRWGGGRRIFFIVAALVVAVAGALVFSRSSDPGVHDFESGPVKSDTDTITSFPVEIGQVFTYGGIVLKNFTDVPATLESVSFEPPLGSAMTLVDLKVAGDDRNVGYVGTSVEFPPARIPAKAVRTFKGAIVPVRPDPPFRSTGVEVLMGLRVNVPGEFGFRHVIVEYRIRGERHRVRLNDGFIACAPVKDYPHCNTATFFDEKE
jgi:hypothetical protein